MNTEKLKQIEKNPEIKLKYLNSGTWGSNNAMYIPVIILVAAVVYLAMYAYFLARGFTWQTNVINIGGSLAIILISALWSRNMNKKIRKKNRERINEFPVCLAKIAMGNDEQRIYYCIYTTGEKRLDTDWLNNINNKIWHTEQESNPQLRSKIDSMFKPRMLATTTKDSTLLPTEFTEGEKVYMKIFGFVPEKDALVKQNDGFFPIIVFNKISAPLIREEDYMD